MHPQQMTPEIVSELKSHSRATRSRLTKVDRAIPFRGRSLTRARFASATHPRTTAAMETRRGREGLLRTLPFLFPLTFPPAFSLYVALKPHSQRSQHSRHLNSPRRLVDTGRAGKWTIPTPALNLPTLTGPLNLNLQPSVPLEPEKVRMKSPDDGFIMRDQLTKSVVLSPSQLYALSSASCRRRIMALW